MHSLPQSCMGKPHSAGSVMHIVHSVHVAHTHTHTHSHTPQPCCTLPVTYLCRCTHAHCYSVFPTHTHITACIYTLCSAHTHTHMHACTHTCAGRLMCLFINANTHAGVGDHCSISRRHRQCRVGVCVGVMCVCACLAAQRSEVAVSW